MGPPYSLKSPLSRPSKCLGYSFTDPCIADKNMRRRDPAFSSEDRHEKKIEGIQGVPYKRRFFRPDDFVFNEQGTLVCPGGSELSIGNPHFESSNGFYGVGYKAKMTACRDCGLRAKCLQNPNTKFRQVYKFEGRHIHPEKETATRRMMKKIDSAMGRFIYSRRMGIVEPVFGNVRYALGLNRFTLCGKEKVNVQWKLFNMVHNLHKILRYGWTTEKTPATIWAQAG